MFQVFAKFFFLIVFCELLTKMLKKVKPSCLQQKILKTNILELWLLNPTAIAYEHSVDRVYFRKALKCS